MRTVDFLPHIFQCSWVRREKLQGQIWETPSLSLKVRGWLWSQLYKTDVDSKLEHKYLSPLSKYDVLVDPSIHPNFFSVWTLSHYNNVTSFPSSLIVLLDSLCKGSIKWMQSNCHTTMIGISSVKMQRTIMTDNSGNNLSPLILLHLNTFHPCFL